MVGTFIWKVFVVAVAKKVTVYALGRVRKLLNYVNHNQTKSLFYKLVVFNLYQ